MKADLPLAVGIVENEQVLGFVLQNTEYPIK